MEAFRVPEPLGDRLGYEATRGLLELLDHEHAKWGEQMLSVGAERFERRLTQEVSALRVDLIRALHEGLSGVRQEVSTSRVELFKWSFLFWVGQIAVVGGMFAFLLRGRP